MDDDKVTKLELSNGSVIWFLGNKIHRNDGPAIEDIRGTQSWYINNKEYSFKDWLNICPLTDSEKAELIIHRVDNDEA